MSKRPGRSTRKFHSKLERAANRRLDMLEKDKLSLESGLGKLVVIVSRRTNFGSRISREDQIAAYMGEAERIKEQRADQHQEVVVRDRAVLGDIVLDLQDPEVTDLVLIGNGSIADFWATGGRHFDWLTAAKKSKHLKQGNIEQRVCGHFPLKTSVPLGTFAIKDQTKIIAPKGRLIADICPPESEFVPVYDKPNNTPEEILQLIDTYYDPLAGRFRRSTSELESASV